ncbi:MAG TPA: ABC-F family ATP-binding cassette domain-containing protein [Bacillota bacterium]|nr:ABC-F family ATP-binding cassette domain-containing protein [Bacillota bacterium]
MAILAVDNLAKLYGIKSVLKSVTFQLEAGERAGLVGRNGSGKTTLLQIITGRIEQDAGTVSIAKDINVGYLTQELEFNPNATVYQSMREIFAELDQLHAEIRSLEENIAACSPEQHARLELLLQQYAEMQERFEARGGFRIESDIQAVLLGLGLPKDRWNKSPEYFSGGERTRVALARLLLTRPSLLLLDEPTNYLDIQAIQWLEGFLKEYPGTVLLVSHDRYFLDRVVNKIFAISDGKVETYRGNYSYYRELSIARRQEQLHAYLEQQKEITRKERFIRESGAGEKEKRQAKSIEKRLSKVERVEKPIEEVSLKAPKLAMSGRTGKIVLTLEEVAKSFGDKELFRRVNLKIRSGERIVVMGPNGTGKSTLLRILMGEEQPDHGDIVWGHGAVPGYYSQIVKDDDLSGSPYDQILALSDFSPTQVRTFLGGFLFRGDEVFTPVKELSGGEQRRLSLAKLVLSPSNLLLLDEPTNHLDLPSLDALEEALLNYTGTIIVVTHDRFFASRIATRLLVLEQGLFTEFATYEAYERWRNDQIERAAIERKEEKKAETARRKERSPDPAAIIRKQKKELERLEMELTQLENTKNQILESLSQPEIYTDFEATQKLTADLHATESLLEEKFEAWASIAENIENEG